MQLRQRRKTDSAGLRARQRYAPTGMMRRYEDDEDFYATEIRNFSNKVQI